MNSLNSYVGFYDGSRPLALAWVNFELELITQGVSTYQQRWQSVSKYSLAPWTSASWFCANNSSGLEISEKKSSSQGKNIKTWPPSPNPNQLDSGEKNVTFTMFTKNRLVGLFSFIFPKEDVPIDGTLLQRFLVPMIKKAGKDTFVRSLQSCSQVVMDKYTKHILRFCPPHYKCSTCG